MNINLAHILLGHQGKVCTQDIVKALGITVVQGSMDLCKACAIAKIKQKNTAQETQGCRKSMIFTKKVYSNLSFI